MAPNSLYPCSVLFDYHTAFAPHKMILPLNEWSPISGGHPAGTNTDWTSGQVDTDDMVVGLVDLLLPFYPNTTVFDSYTIFTYASPTDPARPQVTVPIVFGTGSGSAGTPAAQATFNFKTTGFGVFKLVMLDILPGSNFQPVTSFPSPAYDTTIALRDYLISTANAFRGRDNNRISLLKRITYTLNEKLRKEYHYT